MSISYMSLHIVIQTILKCQYNNWNILLYVFIYNLT